LIVNNKAPIATTPTATPPKIFAMGLSGGISDMSAANWEFDPLDITEG
jgi:hypothetical protein